MPAITSDTMKENYYETARTHFTCNVQRALHVIGEKWMLYILREFLYNGEKQNFNRLLRALKPISSRTLSSKLKKLEERKLITRTLISLQPLKVDYTITRKGKELKKTLICLGDWFIKNSL